MRFLTLLRQGLCGVRGRPCSVCEVRLGTLCGGCGDASAVVCVGCEYAERG